MADKAIPARSEVPQEYTWDLTHIYVSDEKWFAEYEELKNLPRTFAEFNGKLGESVSALLGYFKALDSAVIRLDRLIGYAERKSDEDTGNNFYQDMRGKARSIAVETESACAFADPEIMAIPDETLDKWLEECPGLRTYKRSLHRIRRRRAHLLSPECEELLASAGEVAVAPMQVNSVLHNADMTYPDVCDSSGETHQLTDELLVSLLESPDRALRENTFKSYYKQLGAFRNTFAALIDSQFKMLRFYSGARKYENVLESSLDENEVPPAVYHNLISAVRANLDKMYRYVALRKKALGVEELHMYDVYTPMIGGVAKEIPFGKAKETVLEALGVLGEDYVSILREGFENRWIDVYPNIGKRGGAYSDMGDPHPYVLLNQTDNFDSMLTIAHEMGHSIHSYLSCKNQPVSDARYVIFVAEVASTCNEILLLRHLLSKTQDRRERAYIINNFLDKFKGTVYRQTMFAEFELELGRMSESGETLTADKICAKYHELNKLYFGPDMVSDDEIALEWARIPHFYYNYYVFQYATGFSAAVAIANRILKEGAPAVADYKRFLSGGCSTDPISLLKIAGVDMSTPEPVNSALALFGELINEMESLV
ncbi:MAG: oligoendopeptidase F [Clostridia bacterium]|nr:oligoendopeptidase F [Clostridia bacterium]MBR4799612.1 oligoendopeptidase F [Clostridia bacterium]